VDDVDDVDVVLFSVYSLLCLCLGYMNQGIKWGVRTQMEGNQGFGGLKV
jgi:hypothetical protein